MPAVSALTNPMTPAERTRKAASSKNTNIQLPPVPSGIQPSTNPCKPLYGYAWASRSPEALPEILRARPGPIPKAVVGAWSA